MPPGCSAPTPTVTEILTARSRPPGGCAGVGRMTGSGEAERFVAESASLDITGNDRSGVGQRQGPISLREVLVGMIHEYARHLGHADLLREPAALTRLKIIRESPWYLRAPAWIDGGTKSWPRVYMSSNGVMPAVSPKSYSKLPAVRVGHDDGPAATSSTERQVRTAWRGPRGWSPRNSSR
jgi:Protein of unknown function (DUF664)